MDAKQIEEQAMALPESLRAELAVRLLRTLPAVDLEVSDEDVLQRDLDLESGAVEAITDEDFVRRVQQSRGQ